MKTRKTAALICAAAMILSLAACEERPVETVGTTTTAAIVTKADTTTTAETTAAVETAAETTTTLDDAAPGHFGVFDRWVMLDGELHAIYTIDAIVLLETEEGYSSLSRLLPDYKEHLSALLTDENLRGVTKKVTDEAEKNGTLYLIQNELETDLDDGMKVYSDGEDICLLIRDRDTDRNYFVNVLIDYENQESLKEIDPESYREMEEEGRIIPYDVPNLDLDQIWYAFYPDPSTEPMKPIANEASAEEIAAEETTAAAAETTKPVEPSAVPFEPNTVPFDSIVVPVETNTVPVEPVTTVSESGPPTWETDEYDGQPNPGMPARAGNDLMYGGEEYYLFIDIAPFIYGEDGKCYFLGDGRKTVQEPGYRIKEYLYTGEALTALLRDREPVGKLTYTDGALNADFEVTLKEFDGADLYENGNPKDNYGLTLVSAEPLCYVDGTAVYLAADASLSSR